MNISSTPESAVLEKVENVNSKSNSKSVHLHNDLFLGQLQLQGKDIVSLMRPKAPAKVFELKNSKQIDQLQNRYVIGSSVLLSGFIPNLLNQLSKNTSTGLLANKKLVLTKTNSKPSMTMKIFC